MKSMPCVRRTVLAGVIVLVVGLTSGAPGSSQTIRWKPDERIACVREAAGVTITKTIELRGEIPRAVGAVYRIVGGTATHDADYSGSRFTDVFTTINGSSRVAMLEITLLDDTSMENNETLEIELDAFRGVTVEGPSRARITIVDDEQASVGDIDRCLAIENFDDLYLENSPGLEAWTVEDRAAPFLLSLTNYGSATRHNLQFFETVPVYTRYDGHNSTPGWQCPNGDGENRQCFLTVGSLSSGASAHAIFATRVQDPYPNTVEIYSSATLREISTASSILTDGLVDATERALICGACDADGVISSELNFAARMCLALLGLVVSSAGPEPPNGLPLGLLGTASRFVTIGFEASLLYNVRDRVLRKSPGGRRALELFYDNVGTMFSAANRAPNYYFNLTSSFDHWLLALYSLVVEDGSSPVTSEMVDGFRSFFEDLYPYTTNSFDNLAKAELARLDLDSWVGRPVREAVESLAKLSCKPSAETLCLNQERFRVEVAWRDFQGGAARGRAEQLTGDSGSFWFFDQQNIELMVKVLDGRGVNGHFWVFYGALSNVEYELTVTDTLTGRVRSYSNPEGSFASTGDTNAFSASSTQGSTEQPRTAPAGDTLVSRVDPATLVPLAPLATTVPMTLGSACSVNANTLCLGSGRFEVSVEFTDFQGGSGRGKPTLMTDDTGAFWFFEEANLELIIKVLDGRGVNGHFWVFYGALSNVEFEITITDTKTGSSNTYFNPSGTFASVGDTSAFLP